MPNLFHLLRLANKPIHPTVQRLVACREIDAAGDGQRYKE
jgi:hypothetical protein